VHVPMRADIGSPSPRRCGHPPSGPRRDPRRRDPRRRDGRDGGAGGADGAPRALDAAYQRRHRGRLADVQPGGAASPPLVLPPRGHGAAPRAARVHVLRRAGPVARGEHGAARVRQHPSPAPRCCATGCARCQATGSAAVPPSPSCSA
jgi:hypothetical protein